jgi:hypothetical protein
MKIDTSLQKRHLIVLSSLVSLQGNDIQIVNYSLFLPDSFYWR